MIKTILFDFGDVFIDLDKSATERSLIKLGVTSISNEMLETAMQYEKGLINTEEFIANFRSKYPNISAKKFIEAWNSIILNVPESRLKFIEALSLRKEYRLILLSNTNTLHIEQVIKNMTLARYLRFKNSFDRFYWSHELKLRKPELSIYEYVLTKNNLSASECFFIDDTKENTDAAAKLGIKTWNNNPKKDDVTDLFNHPLFIKA